MKKYTAMILTCSLLLTLLSIPVGAVNSHQVEEMDAATDFYETYWIIENGVLQQISEETYLELLSPQYYSFSVKESDETISPK